MSQIKFKGLGESAKIISMAVLLAGAIILTYYFHVVIGICAVFTHLLYVPIILASIWWKKKGVLVAVFLAIILILGHHFLRVEVMTVNDYFRSLMFVIIASVVALLSSRIEKIGKLLRENEKWLSITLKSIGDAVIATDIKGHVTFINPVAEALTGWKQKEAIGRSINDIFNIINEEIGIPAENPIERVLREGIVVGLANHTVLISKDGSRIPIDDSGAPIIDDKSNVLGVVLVFHDITERRQAEQALRKEKETAQRYFDVAKVFLIAIDSNHKIININKKGCAVTGYSENEILGKNWFDLCIPERLRDDVKAVFSQLIKGEIEPVEYYENPIVTKNGDERIIAWYNTLLKDDSGKIIGCFSSGEDITERRQAEEALAAESERLAVTLRSIGDGVITADIKGNLILMNRIAENLTGWNEEEAKGKPVSRVFHIINEMTRHPCENPVEKVIDKGLIIGLANHTVLISRDGIERFIADSGAPIRIKTGEVIGVVLVFRDVTETRRMQEFISRAQRLETAGRIAGQVAHDFNNLLGPLVAYPDFIRESLPDDHKAIPFLNDMETAADQIADINQQLLTLGRRGHYNQEPLNLNQVIIQVVNRLKPLPDTLVVETNLDKNLLNIKGGASQIYRVVANIITNACDATQNIGQLAIKTENYYADMNSVQFGRVPKGEYVKLTISDTGCGIPENIKPRIFDPFFTTKTTDKRRGSGLGLSVAHAVVEDHNGYIDLESTVGKGTAFYIYFPITREAIETDITDEIVGGSESILVVDDDQVQQDVTVKLLLKLGYRANAVSSGEKAIEFIKENPQDLLILDMIMPEGIDGAETYRKALKISPSQKAIIVSGFAESERAEMALKLGAATFIRKPLTLKTIASAVRKELDRKAK